MPYTSRGRQLLCSSSTWEPSERLVGRPIGSVPSSTRPLIWVMIALVSDPRPREVSHRGDSGIARRAISASIPAALASRHTRHPEGVTLPSASRLATKLLRKRIPMRPATIPPTDQKFIMVVAVAAAPATGHEFRDRRGHRRVLRAYTHRGGQPK